MKRLLITIDGPAGAGKTTVSREVARHLEYTYVDTGALYRAVALAVLFEGCRADDDGKVAQILGGLTLRFENSIRGPRLCMNEVDVSDQIRTHEITMFASALSARRVVRDYLLGVQREMGKNGGVVFEGRDMGTVVFPGADIKFFLDADPNVRALRRYRELMMMGADTSLAEVAESMKKRDDDDSSRALAPLRPARDAIRIDSGPLAFEEVVEVMIRHIAH